VLELEHVIQSDVSFSCSLKAPSLPLIYIALHAVALLLIAQDCDQLNSRYHGRDTFSEFGSLP